VTVDEEKVIKREYEKFVRARGNAKTKREYDPYQEEFVAVLGDTVMAHASTMQDLFRDLKAKRLDPEDYEITKAKIKLIL
jgi:hypothetical protein